MGQKRQGLLLTGLKPYNAKFYQLLLLNVVYRLHSNAIDKKLRYHIACFTSTSSVTENWITCSSYRPKSADIHRYSMSYPSRRCTYLKFYQPPFLQGRAFVYPEVLMLFLPHFEVVACFLHTPALYTGSAACEP